MAKKQPPGPHAEAKESPVPVNLCLMEAPQLNGIIKIAVEVKSRVQGKRKWETNLKNIIKAKLGKNEKLFLEYLRESGIEGNNGCRKVNQKRSHLGVGEKSYHLSSLL